MVAMRFYLPDPSLRAAISTYYVIEHDDPDAGPLIDLLQPEWANIRIVLSGHWRSVVGGERHDSADELATLWGPTSRQSEVRADGHGIIVGVGLLPAGWARFIDAPAQDFVDRCVPLDSIAGESAGALRAALAAAPDEPAMAALLDAHFLAAARASGADDDALMQRAHRLLVEGAFETVDEFAAAVGVSTRTLHRLCAHYFGFAPKLLLRRQRFMRTLARMYAQPDGRWVEQLDDLYYDQPQFVRDFRRFMGLAPTHYFAMPRPLLREAMNGRARLLGQSLQGLHAPPVSPAAPALRTP